MSDQNETIERPKFEGTKVPEAGGIVFGKLYGKTTDKEGNKRVVEYNITSRAETPLQALENLLKTQSYSEKVYHLTPYDPGTKQAPSNTSKPTDEKPVSHNPEKPKGGGTYHIVKIKVEPQEDGKSKVSMFTDMEGMTKYPVLYAVKTPEQLVETFAASGDDWNPEHFESAVSFEVNWDVVWLESDKLNSKGFPYKNITSVRAA
jgi:hypothetical protein